MGHIEFLFRATATAALALSLSSCRTTDNAKAIILPPILATPVDISHTPLDPALEAMGYCSSNTVTHEQRVGDSLLSTIDTATQFELNPKALTEFLGILQDYEESNFMHRMILPDGVEENAPESFDIIYPEIFEQRKVLQVLLLNSQDSLPTMGYYDSQKDSGFMIRGDTALFAVKPFIAEDDRDFKPATDEVRRTILQGATTAWLHGRYNNEHIATISFALAFTDSSIRDMGATTYIEYLYKAQEVATGQSAELGTTIGIPVVTEEMFDKIVRMGAVVNSCERKAA